MIEIEVVEGNIKSLCESSRIEKDGTESFLLLHLEITDAIRRLERCRLHVGQLAMRSMSPEVPYDGKAVDAMIRFAFGVPHLFVSRKT